MLKIRPHIEDISINALVTSSDIPSDGDFYTDKLLDRGLASAINPIIDGEIIEYKPNYPSINLNVFFMRFFTQGEISEFTQYTSDHFNAHVNKSKIDLGLITVASNTPSRVVRQPFEHLQDNQSRQTELKSEKGKTRLQQLGLKPYVVRNKLGLANTKRPSQSGVPIFYDSFMIPFWNKKLEWVNNSNLFNKSSYLYNSILLMEIYDSNGLSPKRILSIPIFVNKRYNASEQSYSIPVLKPEFNLTDGTDGFNLFLLKNYNIKEFYVRFSFWDALNGRKINLLPSTPNMVKQKWIQSVNTFKNESLYLKYVIDVDMLKYDIYGYNIDTNNYDLAHNQIDLYELVFDEFWDNTIVVNTPVITSSLLSSVTSTRSNPFTFSIKNIKGSLKLKQNFDFYKWVIPNIGDTVLRETLLNIQRQKPNSFLFINENFDDERLLYTIANFSIKNASSDTWVIRKVELRDILVTKDDIENDIVLYESTIAGGRPYKFQTANAISVLKYSNDYYNGESDVFKYILENTNCFYDIIHRLVMEFISLYVQNFGSALIPFFDLINTIKGGGVNNNQKISDITEFFRRLSFFLPSVNVTNVTNVLVDKFMVEFLKLKNSTDLTAYNNLINFIIKYKNEKESSNNEVVLVFNEEQNKYKSIIPFSWRKHMAFKKYFGVNSLDDKSLKSFNDTNFIGKLPTNIYSYSNTITFSVRSGVDFYMRPNETATADLAFNVGGKILHTFIDTQKVNISGSAVICLTNSATKEEKNIIIPIDLTLTTK